MTSLTRTIISIESVRNGGKSFFWIIEVTVANSFILFKESQPEEKQKGLTLKKFRRQLIAQLIPEPESEEARSRSRAGNDIFNNELKYSPQLLLKNYKSTMRRLLHEKIEKGNNVLL